MLERNIRPIVIKFVLLALWPSVELSGVHDDLPFGILLDVGAIHRARGRPFEIDSLAIVAAAVTRAFEFVFRGFPIGRAAEMRAARKDDKQAVGSFVHPDAILLLPFIADADVVIVWKADAELGGRFKDAARQKEAHEHQKDRKSTRLNSSHEWI